MQLTTPSSSVSPTPAGISTHVVLGGRAPVSVGPTRAVGHSRAVCAVTLEPVPVLWGHSPEKDVSVTAKVRAGTLRGRPRPQSRGRARHLGPSTTQAEDPKPAELLMEANPAYRKTAFSHAEDNKLS